jgi:glycosyltransferase involved in cell wall biosynthesis
MISVIFPTYNEASNVRELHQRILSALIKIGQPFEIIAVVEIASTDDTIKILKSLSPITVITIGYRTGKSVALDAGIRAAKGDLIVTIDADLQNDPADILVLYKKITEGYDAVIGWRQGRNDPLSRKIFSYAANKLTDTVLGVGIHDYGCALLIFKKGFVGRIRLYGEMHVFLVYLFKSEGARITEVPIKHFARTKGVSKTGIPTLTKILADLLLVRFFINNTRPLLTFLNISLISWGAAFLLGSVSIWLKIADLRDFTQTPLPVITSLFIILGFLSVMMGALAELIIRIYYEARDVSPYTVHDVTIRDDKRISKQHELTQKRV